MPGQPPIHWTIRDVEPGRAYTIEGDSLLDGAVLLAHWRFDPRSECTATLTQRLELRGEHGAASVDEIKAAFETNLEPGVRRIARTMECRYCVAREAHPGGC